MRCGRLLVAGGFALGLAVPSSFAAELQPRTVAAFDHYVRVTEAQTAESRVFLRVDGLPDTERRARLDELGKGQLVIERVVTREAGRPINPSSEVPWM